GDVHVPGVVEDASAVGTVDDFALRLGVDDVLAGELHVASAADAALDADDDVASLVAENALVAGEKGRIEGGGELAARGGCIGELRGKPGFRLGELFELVVDVRADPAELLAEAPGFRVGGLDLLHELELLIFEGADRLPAGLDLVRE